MWVRTHPYAPLYFRWNIAPTYTSDKGNSADAFLYATISETLIWFSTSQAATQTIILSSTLFRQDVQN